jgi:glutathione S-transferase
VSAPVTIIGSYVSPYVRKVLVALDLKGIPYRIDPIIPFFGTDRFTALSPVRRIPVLVDDCVSLADSTVICEYLEERYPRPALLPQGPDRRARARWLEEFADTRMGEVFIWRLFNQVVINRFVWGEATDEDVLRKALDQEIPAILDYLERGLPLRRDRPSRHRHRRLLPERVVCGLLRRPRPLARDGMLRIASAGASELREAASVRRAPPAHPDPESQGRPSRGGSSVDPGDRWLDETPPRHPRRLSFPVRVDRAA